MKFDVKEFKENAKKVMEEQIKNNELSFSELVAKSDALVEELNNVRETIMNAYCNERTEIGKNVIRQLAAQIGVKL